MVGFAEEYFAYFGSSPFMIGLLTIMLIVDNVQHTASQLEP